MTTTHPYVDADRLADAVPDRMLRWELYGAGLESLGRDDAPLLRDVPRPGPGELLARVDACGICFSDIKIINLGGRHPRLQGRDLAADPVVMGHEVSVTIVAAGPGVPAPFGPGQRAIIQADVYSGGINKAFGYRIAGGSDEVSIARLLNNFLGPRCPHHFDHFIFAELNQLLIIVVKGEVNFCHRQTESVFVVRECHAVIWPGQDLP